MIGVVLLSDGRDMTQFITYFLAVLAIVPALSLVSDDSTPKDTTKRELDYVLSLSQARRLKFPVAGGQSKILVTLIVFDRGIAEITSISETGRQAFSLVSTNQIGPGTNKGFTGGARISDEKLESYTKTLADLPPETPTLVLERLFIVRYPDDEGLLQTKQYDLGKLPRSLRRFRQITVRDSGVFKERKPPRRGADGQY